MKIRYLIYRTPLKKMLILMPTRFLCLYQVSVKIHYFQKTEIVFSKTKLNLVRRN